MKTKHPALGPQARAVYELIRVGHLTPHMAPLYQRELSALARANLITRTPDGRFEAPAVLVDGTPRPPSVPPPPPPPPPKPILVNLNVRVPAEVIEALDMLASDAEDGNRSDVARGILAEALPRLLEARTRPARTKSGTAPRTTETSNGAITQARAADRN